MIRRALSQGGGGAFEEALLRAPIFPTSKFRSCGWRGGMDPLGHRSHSPPLFARGFFHRISCIYITVLNAIAARFRARSGFNKLRHERVVSAQTRQER